MNYKACFQHDIAYGDFKDLGKRTAADKVLRDKAFNIAEDPRYDGYQQGLASMAYKFFDKKTKGSGLSHTIKSMSQNQQLADEFINPLLENLKREKYIQHSKKTSGVLV